MNKRRKRLKAWLLAVFVFCVLIMFQRKFWEFDWPFFLTENLRESNTIIFMVFKIIEFISKRQEKSHEASIDLQEYDERRWDRLQVSLKSRKRMENF